jgi:hypothetical protein
MERYANFWLMFAAVVTFTAVFAPGEALFRNSNTLAGIATMCAGSVVVVLDLRYFRRRGFGGSVMHLPAWLIGLVAIGCGVAMIVKDLK